MTNSPIQLALHRLRDFASSAQPQNTRSPIPKCEAIDRLIALAAAYAGECRTAYGEQLEAHLIEFHQAVGGLDDARTAIRQTLGRLREDVVYVPDESAPPSPVRRRFVKDGDGLRVEFDGGAPNALQRIVTGLEDVWDVIWDLHAAYRDLDRLLGARLTPKVASAVKAWRGSLRVYTAADERYRLFGTYLLERCYQTVEPQKSQVGHDDLPERLARNTTRFMQSIVEAADYLAGPVAERQRCVLASHGAGQPEGCDSRTLQGFHSQHERRPEEFGRGPLSGPPTVLALIICPVFGAGTGHRALYKLGANGRIWVTLQPPERAVSGIGGIVPVAA
jgi:hypothetical protein